jgi:hypothetical protein
MSHTELSGWDLPPFRSDRLFFRPFALSDAEGAFRDFRIGRSEMTEMWQCFEPADVAEGLSAAGHYVARTRTDRGWRCRCAISGRLRWPG